MGYLLLIPLVLAILVIGFPLLIMFAWGLFAPAVFGLPYLTFWQAFGLQWLVGILMVPAISTSRK